MLSSFCLVCCWRSNFLSSHQRLGEISKCLPKCLTSTFSCHSERVVHFVRSFLLGTFVSRTMTRGIEKIDLSAVGAASAHRQFHRSPSLLLPRVRLKRGKVLLGALVSQVLLKGLERQSSLRCKFQHCVTHLRTFPIVSVCFVVSAAVLTSCPSHPWLRTCLGVQSKAACLRDKKHHQFLFLAVVLNRHLGVIVSHC